MTVLLQITVILSRSQTTTTRNLSILEEAGLVVRVPHHDPRVKLMKLTPKGKQKRQVALDYWQEMQDDIVSSVLEDDWKTFQRVLSEIDSRCKEQSI
jgi:DNA-binding MarR family transcriptional regulator